jgi:hypothetical protein
VESPNRPSEQAPTQRGSPAATNANRRLIASYESPTRILLDEPMLGFVEVPVGPFLMGSDSTKDKASRER